MGQIIKYISNILIFYLLGGYFMLSRKMAQVGKECVACGCCANVCPKGAIDVVWGIAAQVDWESCVGCGKCAKVCPAAVIELVERDAMQ